IGVGDADDRPVERVIREALRLDEGLAQEQRKAGIAVGGQTFAEAGGHAEFLKRTFGECAPFVRQIGPANKGKPTLRRPPLSFPSPASARAPFPSRGAGADSKKP